MTLIRVSRNVTGSQIIERDCIELHSNRQSWYGGPQQKRQYWPVDKLQLKDYSYLTKEADNCGIAERYWLNSVGGFVYVDSTSPLFIDQNIDKNHMCLVAKKALPFDTHTNTYTFNYFIGIGRDSRQVHLEAVHQLLKKPSGHPDERMVRHPIWSTWARYKRDINTSVVDEFADEILANKFNNAQFEIDDDWEICYGALTFNEKKFPDIKALTDKLKQKGFRVTLWIHPFINKACEPYYTAAKQKG